MTHDKQSERDEQSRLESGLTIAEGMIRVASLNGTYTCGEASHLRMAYALLDLKAQLDEARAEIKNLKDPSFQARIYSKAWLSQQWQREMVRAEAAEKQRDEALALAEKAELNCSGLITVEIDLRNEIERLKKDWEDARTARWDFLETKIESAEKERDSVKELVKDLCAEWNEDCNETCDSYAHDETCRAVNIAEAKRAMREEIAQLRAELSALRDVAEAAREFRTGYEKTSFTNSTLAKLFAALDKLK